MSTQPRNTRSITTQPKTNRASTQNTKCALETAKRALAILQKQAAGYTALTIPVHLQIEIEEKNKEITTLKNGLYSTDQTSDILKLEQQNRLNTNEINRKRHKRYYKRRQKFQPVLITQFFRMIILLATLFVAGIAITLRVYEPTVWAFLGSIAGFAALTVKWLEVK